MDTISTEIDYFEVLNVNDTLKLLDYKTLPPNLEALAINDRQRNPQSLLEFGNFHDAIEFAWNLYKYKNEHENQKRNFIVNFYIQEFQTSRNYAKILTTAKGPVCDSKFAMHMAEGYGLYLEKTIEEKLPLGGQIFKERFLKLVNDRMSIIISRYKEDFNAISK